jgi:hypothetical protein
MAISARSRRGTSASFWRNHNAMQLMMAQACMPSVRPVTKVKRMTIPPIVPFRGPAPKVFVAKM